MNLFARLLSPQTRAIYDVIAEADGPVAADWIGDALGMFPNGVYRSVDRLAELGLVRRIESAPVTFVAQDISVANSITHARLESDFTDMFGSIKTAASTTAIKIIRNKSQLMRDTTTDVSTATDRVDFLVSGLEVSAATLAEYRRAVERGVTIRALVQHRRETTKAQLQSWREIGVEYRYTAFCGIRLFVIDSAISFAVSYDSKNTSECYGIRFAHQPFALSQSQLFEEKWSQARPVLD